MYLGISKPTLQGPFDADGSLPSSSLSPISFAARANVSSALSGSPSTSDLFFNKRLQFLVASNTLLLNVVDNSANRSLRELNSAFSSAPRPIPLFFIVIISVSIILICVSSFMLPCSFKFESALKMTSF